jgi:hypothetical protein
VAFGIMDERRWIVLARGSWDKPEDRDNKIELDTVEEMLFSRNLNNISVFKRLD